MIKKFFLVIGILIGVSSLSNAWVLPFLAGQESSYPCKPLNAHIQVCFSPHENCCIKVIKAIESAQKTVYVQAYSFTHDEIAESLVNAKKRGVKVIVYIDKGRDKEPHSKTPKLRDNDVPVILQDQSKRGLAHNKIMIIDDDLVITGSFNWTKNALRNEENINFIKSKELADAYIENWYKTIILND